MHAPVNGINLFYEQHGQGEDFIMIHGLGSSTLDWEFQVGHFASRYRVTCIDMRGFGRSDKPAPPYSIEQMARDTIAVMDHLHIHRAHVLGLSMGGMVAQWMAILAPERVHKLILASTAAKLRPRGLDHLMILLKRAIKIPVATMESIARHISGQLFPEPQQAELRQICYERLSQNDLGCFRAGARACIKMDSRDYLPRLKAPTFIIVGDEDPLIPLVFSKELHRLIPTSEYMVLPMSRHACSYDQPERFNHEVSRFLDGHH